MWLTPNQQRDLHLQLKAQITFFKTHNYIGITYRQTMANLKMFNAVKYYMLCKQSNAVAKELSKILRRDIKIESYGLSSTWIFLHDKDYFEVVLAHEIALDHGFKGKLSDKESAMYLESVYGQLVIYLDFTSYCTPEYEEIPESEIQRQRVKGYRCAERNEPI